MENIRKTGRIARVAFLEDPDEEPIPITVLPQTPPPVIPPSPDVIEVIDDKLDKVEDTIPSTESSNNPIVDMDDIVEAPIDDPVEPVPYFLIENAPVFPGCEGLNTNEERKNV